MPSEHILTHTITCVKASNLFNIHTMYVHSLPWSNCKMLGKYQFVRRLKSICPMPCQRSIAALCVNKFHRSR